MMLTGLEKIRADTLANNLIWLESFGCKVRSYGNSVYVAHPRLRQYRAWLLVGSPAEALGLLKAVAAGIGPASAPPQIYVDETADSPELRAELGAARFEATFISSINAGVWSPLGGPAGVSLRSTRPDEITLWASLYSEGFGRSGGDAEDDLERWKRSMDGGEVSHWFLAEGERVIGVCQTCAARGVIGIYSFTIKPSERDAHRLRRSLRALRAGLTRRGEALIYFERIRTNEAGERRRAARPALGAAVVRRMTAYQRGS